MANKLSSPINEGGQEPGAERIQSVFTQGWGAFSVAKNSHGTKQHADTCNMAAVGVQSDGCHDISNKQEVMQVRYAY